MTEGRRHVVIYDGQCPFCRRQMEWIRARDRAGRLEFLPWESPERTARFPQLALAALEDGMRVVRPDGQIETGAAGVAEILHQLPGWRGVAWMLRVPGLRVIAGSMYRWVATHRQHLA